MGKSRWAYAGLNRLEEARATINAALQRKGNTASYHSMLASLDWSEGKDADMEKELQSAAATPEGALAVLGFRAGLAAARGQVRQAREFLRQAEDAMDRLHLQGRADIEAGTGACRSGGGQSCRSRSAAPTRRFKLSRIFPLW